MGTQPSLSIVICTKNRRELLARAIDSIRASGEDGRRAELVVVEETESPRDIAGTRYVPIPPTGRGFGHARNVGIDRATGELVLFVDDDCEVEAGWVGALTEPFLKDPKILGAAGAVLVRNCGLIGHAENILGFPGGGLRYLDESRGQIVPTRFLSTCNCAYRRDALRKAGGFLEDARMGAEDSLMAERMTTFGQCIYTSKAVVYHLARDRLGAIFQWFIRRGRGEVGHFHLTAQPTRSIWYFLRSSWLLRLAGLAVLLYWWPWTAVLVPPGLLVYYGAVLWRFRFARAYPSYRRAWWIVPIVKVTMDLGAEVGRWKAFLRRGT